MEGKGSNNTVDREDLFLQRSLAVGLGVISGCVTIIAGLVVRNGPPLELWPLFLIVLWLGGYICILSRLKEFRRDEYPPDTSWLFYGLCFVLGVTAPMSIVLWYVYKPKFEIDEEVCVENQGHAVLLTVRDRKQVKGKGYLYLFVDAKGTETWRPESELTKKKDAPIPLG